MASPALWARLLSTSGGGKRGPVALLLPARGLHSQHRPCAQAKRNRAGREMTHPPLENASSPGSLPQQPSERHWAPKPRAGRAFSQQTPGPLLCPQLPQSSGPPAPPTGSCLSRPKMRQEAGGLPLPQDSPTPLETPSLCLLPTTLHPGRPQNLSWRFLFKGPAAGGYGRKDTPGHNCRAAGILQRAFHRPFPGPGAPAGELHFPLGNSGSGERTPRLASPREG